MKPIKAIIIEDEVPASDLLSAHLKEHKHISVIDICSDGFAGLKAIQEKQPDLIFLDVQMPKLTGFEMLEILENPPVIIFTTAFDEYAIKAFEMNAVDYLLKPFSRQRFADALQKAEVRIEMMKSGSQNDQEKSPIAVFPPGKYIDRIVVKKNNRIIVLPVSSVSHIEAYDDYVFIHSEENKNLKQKTMRYYEQYLDPKRFIRIHRSWIVNIEFIDQILLGKRNLYG